MIQGNKVCASRWFSTVFFPSCCYINYVLRCLLLHVRLLFKRECRACRQWEMTMTVQLIDYICSSSVARGLDVPEFRRFSRRLFAAVKPITDTEEELWCVKLDIMSCELFEQTVVIPINGHTTTPDSDIRSQILTLNFILRTSEG